MEVGLIRKKDFFFYFWITFFTLFEMLIHSIKNVINIFFFRASLLYLQFRKFGDTLKKNIITLMDLILSSEDIERRDNWKEVKNFDLYYFVCEYLTQAKSAFSSSFFFLHFLFQIVYRVSLFVKACQ